VNFEVVTLMAKKFAVCRVEVVKVKAVNSPTEVSSFPSYFSESLLGRLQCLYEVFVLKSRVLHLDARGQHLSYWINGNVEDYLGVCMCCMYVSVMCCVTYVTTFKAN
jgi:hypothetical protein